MRFQIVACADAAPSIDYLKRGLDAFRRSAGKFGHEPLLLGWGDKWRGLGTKPRMLKRAIENGVIKADLILFCDAFDVAFLDDPEQVPVRDSILFNAERNCFPDASLAPEFDKDAVSSYRYLNSGVSIGRTEDYLAALKAMRAEDIPDDHWHTKPDKTRVRIEPNDQLYWQQVHVARSAPTVLDGMCDWFQTTHGTKDGDLLFQHGKVLNTETGTSPIVIHANGDKNASTWLSVCEWASK